MFFPLILSINRVTLLSGMTVYHLDCGVAYLLSCPWEEELNLKRLEWEEEALQTVKSFAKMINQQEMFCWMKLWGTLKKLNHQRLSNLGSNILVGRTWNWIILSKAKYRLINSRVKVFFWCIITKMYYGGKQKIMQKPHFKVSTCLEKKVGLLNISQWFFFATVLLTFQKHTEQKSAQNSYPFYYFYPFETT